MGKETINTFGSLKIKMDKKDTNSRDKKPPHVSFVVNNSETKPHVYFDKLNEVVGNDKDEKAAIYWLRDNKSKLIEQYNKWNS